GGLEPGMRTSTINGVVVVIGYVDARRPAHHGGEAGRRFCFDVADVRRRGRGVRCPAPGRCGSRPPGGRPAARRARTRTCKTVRRVRRAWRPPKPRRWG